MIRFALTVFAFVGLSGPLQAAVDPAYESRSDWEIFKSIAHKFQEVAPEIDTS